MPRTTPLRLSSSEKAIRLVDTQGSSPRTVTWRLFRTYLRRRDAWQRQLGELMKERQALDQLARDLVATALFTAPGPPESDSAGNAPLPKQVEAYERALILKALARCGGNQSEAAVALGVLPTTLCEKLKRLGLREVLQPPKH